MKLRRRSIRGVVHIQTGHHNTIITLTDKLNRGLLKAGRAPKHTRSVSDTAVIVYAKQSDFPGVHMFKNVQCN
jgi:hypothetical protein